MFSFRFAPSLDVVSYTGDKERREELRQAVKNSDTWNVLLTTYEVEILKNMVYCNMVTHH